MCVGGAYTLCLHLWELVLLHKCGDRAQTQARQCVPLPTEPYRQPSTKGMFTSNKISLSGVDVFVIFLNSKVESLVSVLNATLKIHM